MKLRDLIKEAKKQDASFDVDNIEGGLLMITDGIKQRCISRNISPDDLVGLIVFQIVEGQPDITKKEIGEIFFSWFKHAKFCVKNKESA